MSASREAQRLGDTAARVAVMGADDLRATSAATLDDALRQVPGFSLFRPPRIVRVGIRLDHSQGKRVTPPEK